MSSENHVYFSSSEGSTDLDSPISTPEAEEIAEEEELEGESKSAEEAAAPEAAEAEAEAEESLKCIVCYEKLDVNNIVNTQCDHKYCWECFFKWIKTNPTCPYCRCDFLSEDVWYQNRDVQDDATNMRSLVNILQLDLIKSSRELFMINKEKEKMICKTQKLKAERRLNLQSVISLNEQIEYMRGYLTALRGDETEKIIVKRVRNTPWFRGFTYGMFEINQERNAINYEKLNSFVHAHSKLGHAFRVSKNWVDRDKLEDQINFTFGDINNTNIEKYKESSKSKNDDEEASKTSESEAETSSPTQSAPTAPEMTRQAEEKNEFDYRLVF